MQRITIGENKENFYKIVLERSSIFRNFKKQKKNIFEDKKKKYCLEIYSLSIYLCN